MPRISVCIPLRNEEAELPGLFASLEALHRPDNRALGICLLLDGCTDASAALAEGYRARSTHEVLIVQEPPAPSNAGRARHLAMTAGIGALQDDGGLLLSTDADSRPAPNWLGAMTAAASHADVVVGRIARSGSRPCPLQDRVEAYYNELFALRRRLDPVAWEAPVTHHHCGGANIGIRADAYRALGGFAPMPSGEDARLVDDAARAGLRVRRDAASLVHTSARREGRVAGGLAASLRHLDAAEAAAVRVAHPVDAAWQYRMHGEARAAHARDRLDLIATTIGLSDDHVRGVARDCPNAEAFAMRIVPEPPNGMRSVPLPVAEAELAKLTGVSKAA